MSIDPASIVLRFGVMIASLTVHEFAHAATAHWLGDRTPSKQGRLTLNPMAHIDPIGTVVMPLIQAVTGIPTIGWAKPVMVNIGALRRIENKRLAHALVAVAGPLSNLLLAIVSLTILALVGRAMPAGAVELLSLVFMLNVGLFVFNLLPIPGLDGSRLLPASLDGWQKKVQPYSSLILLVIVSVPAIAAIVVRWPVTMVSNLLIHAFGMRAL